MSYDLSTADAELDALGELPANLDELVTRYAGDVSDRSDLDAALDALGEVPEALYDAVRASDGPLASEQSKGPESGEILLPSPAGRDEPRSGAKSVPVAREQSGSFQVPTLDDDGAAEDPAGAMQDAMRSQLTDSELDGGAQDVVDPEGADEDGGPDTEQIVLEEGLAPAGGSREVFTLDGEDDFESEPPQAVAEPEIETTQVVPTAAAQAAVAAAAEEVAAKEMAATEALNNPPEEVDEEDPADVEFDAMFDDLTRPSMAPAAPAEAHDSAPEVDADPPRVGPVDDEDTQIFDSADFGALALSAQQGQSSAAPEAEASPASADADSEEFDLDVLDVDELEMVMEDDEEAPPASTPPEGEKKGGLLGRLLGRKDKDS